MEVDHITPLVIDSFLSGGVSSILQGEESEGKSEIAKIEEVRAIGKYLKMLKVGLSEEVVKQRMEADGLSLEVIDRFFVM
jgi:hypothetical protein